ncbi:MAG TPA: hypothetical protein VFC00_23885 [Micromonosporaceae bacterium]|nr:hypothetical protein [Micromonosporaceae bacterium]
MNTGKMLAWLVGGLLALVAVGALAIWLLKVLLGLAVYLIVGAVVVAGGVYLYRRVRRSIAPGTRNQRRIEAAVKTYKMRNGS